MRALILVKGMKFIMKNISEKLFFLSYGIYLIFTILDSSFYSTYIHTYLNYIMIICTFILIFSELLNKKISIKELCLLFICGFLFILLFMHLNGPTMLPLFFYIYSSRNVDFNKIAKFTIIICSLLLIFIVTSAFLGIIENYKNVSADRVRIYLGFRYPLYPQMILFNIIMCDFYTHRKKISIRRALFWCLVNYWMFSYTNARLSFYLATIIIITLYYLQNKTCYLEKRKLLLKLCILAFPISSLFSLYITFNYDNSNIMMRNLNEFSNGRLYFGKKSLSEYPINLLGNNVSYFGAGLDIYGNKNVNVYNYVDCLYISLLEKYGIIFNVLFLIFITYISYKIADSKNYFLLLIFVGYAIHGIIDDSGILLNYNAFWLSISGFFRKKL